MYVSEYTIKKKSPIFFILDIFMRYSYMSTFIKLNKTFFFIEKKIDDLN